LTANLLRKFLTRFPIFCVTINRLLPIPSNKSFVKIKYLHDLFSSLTFTTILLSNVIVSPILIWLQLFESALIIPYYPVMTYFLICQNPTYWVLCVIQMLYWVNPYDSTHSSRYIVICAFIVNNVKYIIFY
jgi:hypothetical protein